MLVKICLLSVSYTLIYKLTKEVILIDTMTNISYGVHKDNISKRYKTGSNKNIRVQSQS